MGKGKAAQSKSKKIRLTLGEVTNALPMALARPWGELDALAALLRHQLRENPPLILTEGVVIHNGMDPQLDDLHKQLDNQDAWLAKQDDRLNTGIRTMKLKQHRTFGYFLSVRESKATSAFKPTPPDSTKPGATAH